MSDIKVRPVKGMDAVTYLDPGALTSPLSYVRQPPLYTFKLKPSRIVVLIVCVSCRWSLVVSCRVVIQIMRCRCSGR